MFGFFKKNDKEILNKQQKDLRIAECPYCKEQLSKIPGAKTKCPHCGKFIFVRTRPKDNARLVVTQKEADQIDEEWRIVSGTQELFIEDKKRFEKQRDLLRKRFGGKEPSENDVWWGLLNEDLLEDMKKGQWGSYTSTKLKMADILRKEMKLKHALQIYLEICYLDLNGPLNMMIGENDNIIFDSEYNKPFDLECAFLAPGIVDYVKILKKKLSLNTIDLKNIFIEHNRKIEKSLNLPLSPQDSWVKLEKKISN